MAEYRIGSDEETGITLIEFEGKIVCKDLLAFMHGDSLGNRMSLVVCDFSKAALDGIASGELMRKLRVARPLGKPGIKVAYIQALIQTLCSGEGR